MQSVTGIELLFFPAGKFREDQSGVYLSPNLSLIFFGNACLFTIIVMVFNLK
jgi:hypothetical protein